MAEIIPAILPSDFLDLRASLAKVRFLSPFVQIDICDGVFVPSVTWPYGNAQEFEEILKGNEGLPFWEDFQFEFDLMIKDPEEALDDWIDAGASRVIVHNKSTKKLDEILERLRYAGIEAGIALQVDEDISLIEPYVEKVTFVQCMGISEIGVQGNPFDERVLSNIREIATRFPSLTISVDGGVSAKTAPALVNAGTHRLVSGSAVLKAEDPQTAFRSLTERANQAPPDSPQV